MATNHLLEEFPPVSTETWEAAITKDLKGADYAKRLVWQTPEGLAVKPYYRADSTADLKYPLAAPGEFPYARGTRAVGGWRIREEIDATHLEEANRAAQAAVVSGAEEISFTNAAVANASDLAMLLVNLQEIPVHFENANEVLIRLLIERLKGQKSSSEASTGLNPFANLDLAAEIIAAATASLTPFTIHGEEFEESGATAVEEVGFTLAAGIDFIAAMQERGVSVDRAAASVAFSFAIGGNYFFQIAKLRAFRMLWAQAVKSFGGAAESAKARIFARTSRWNKTIFDAHVNVLRGTTEAMSAILGGADSLTVAPFDACYKSSDEASNRLARNTQIILKQEALFSRVADPAGGSYYIESVTDFIARDGWKLMQQIEADGGYRTAQAKGTVAAALTKSLAARDKAVSSRRRIFTGTNQHPNLTEKALDRIDATRGNGVRRGTEGYEQLRLRTERHGKPVRVLLAEIGDVKMRAARSGFAANFFGCAGFDCVTQRFNSVDEIVASEAALIVLCSSDAEYLALATELLAKLKGKTPVVIAGAPESTEQLQAAGVADFVHVRSNPIEVLAKWQQRLGIKE
jgi:methylmalonyl-CoA mutase